MEIIKIIFIFLREIIMNKDVFLKSLEKRKKLFDLPQQKKQLVIFFRNKPEEHKVK